MARRDALLRLHQSLLARRAALRNQLAGELDDLSNVRTAAAARDPADMAFEEGSNEIASQLAERDAGELAQIDRALARLKLGTCGRCELCQAKIPAGRLQALPYTTRCIGCQREVEQYPARREGRGAGGWQKVFDAAAPPEDQREVDLAALEAELSGDR
jgi:DnaK suppressor protein